MSGPSIPRLVVSHWLISWPLTLAAAATVAVYAACALRLGRRWPARRTLSFVAGIAAVVVALESGIGAHDDELLSVHMVQHMLLLLAAPVLLLLGRPLVLWLRTLPPRRRRGVGRSMARVRPFTTPAVSLLIFCAVVLLTHLPSVYELTLRHPIVHEAEHVLYIAAGLLLFSPLLGGDPGAARRLGGLGRFVYLIGAMLPMAIVGAYLNRAPHVLYLPYLVATHGSVGFALKDQAQAGAIMWTVGNMIMVVVGLWAVLACMLEEERNQRVRDVRQARLGDAPAGPTAARLQDGRG